MKLYRCLGEGCPLRERCICYRQEYPDLVLSSSPYKGGLCEYFTTKEQYETRTGKSYERD